MKPTGECFHSGRKVKAQDDFGECVMRRAVKGSTWGRGWLELCTRGDTVYVTPTREGNAPLNIPR